MTAKEIRASWEESGAIDETVAPFYLMEIAAQLAELNETLRGMATDSKSRAQFSAFIGGK